MISVTALWRWAVTSNERAVANARAAATECSRLRVERAEVELYLASYAEGEQRSSVEAATKAVARAHEPVARDGDPQRSRPDRGRGRGRGPHPPGPRGDARRGGVRRRRAGG